MNADFNRFAVVLALLATFALVAACASDLGGTCHDDSDCASALRCLRRPQSNRGICVYPESLHDLGSDLAPSLDLRHSDAAGPLDDLLRDQTLDNDTPPVAPDLSQDHGEAPHDLAPKDSRDTELGATDTTPDARPDAAADLSHDASPPHDAPRDHIAPPGDATPDVIALDTPASDR